MKKYLPLILFVVGVVVVVGVFFVVKGRKKDSKVEVEETALIEVPLEKRPVVSLTPTEDGHYLNLKVEKIMIEGATSMDYQLLYDVPNAPSQGIPGTVDIEGKDSFEAELLLGSESSGKFRYDEGVEEGTITLRFRNEEGKLLVKFSAEFHLQSASSSLTSLNEKFTFELDSIPKKGYFVTMETIGFPNIPPGDVTTNIYGVFSSSDDKFPGTVLIGGVETYYRWADERNNKEVLDPKGNMDDVGIFAGISNTPEG
jgi:hypothetical protein